MRKTFLFVINPISGIGKQKKVERLVKKLLNPELFDYKFVYTQAPKHAYSIAREYANKVDVIVAVGGDGTINEIASGIVNSETALGIIPTGSGNGFARFLKIPQNPEKAIIFLATASEKSIDSIKINDFYFFNVAGVGFDADISHLFANYGKRGFNSYLQIISKHIRNFKTKQYVLQLDDKTVTETAFLISFANSSTWGNNAHIAPLAQIDDGFLDITIIEDFPMVSAPILAARLFAKNIHKSKFEKSYRCKELTIKNDGILLAHVDGEPLTFTDDVKMTVAPKSLKVMTHTNSFLFEKIEQRLNQIRNFNIKNAIDDFLPD